MALQLATGTRRNDTFSVTANVHTQQTVFLDAINTTLLAAGWTSTAVAAYCDLLYTGQPANTNTITIGGDVYTFVTTLTATPRQVLIDTTADLTYQNLIYALEQNPSFVGIKYGTGTVASTFVRGSLVTSPSARIRFTSLTTGPAGNFQVALTETLANAAYESPIGATAYVLGGGYKWLSADTPAKLRCKIWGRYQDFNGNAPQVRMLVSDDNDINFMGAVGLDANNASSTANGPRLRWASIANWRIIANRYQVFIMGDGVSAASDGGWFHAGTIWLPDGLTPVELTNATNTAPVVYTTNVPHTFTTGDSVCVRGVLGNTGANFRGTITVLSPTTFSGNGTVGNGVYVSGGARVGKIGSTIAEAIIMSSSITAGGGSPQLRKTLVPSNFTGSLLNGSLIYSNTGLSTAPGRWKVGVCAPATLDGAERPVQLYNNNTVASDATVFMNETELSDAKLCGQLYDCVIDQRSKLGTDSGTIGALTWQCLTDTNAGGTDAAQASVFVAIN